MRRDTTSGDWGGGVRAGDVAEAVRDEAGPKVSAGGNAGETADAAMQEGAFRPVDRGTRVPVDVSLSTESAVVRGPQLKDADSTSTNST
jgi:hypothetical protein